MEHSKFCRRIVESAWYQNNWRRRFSRDQNTGSHFRFEEGGERKIATIGGATGFGADYLIVDDPHAVTDAFSDTKLTATTNWFTESWMSRKDDPKEGAFVVIMQRVSEKDVSAHCIKTGGWEHLCLPMEYDPRRHCRTSIGWEDWRRREGELLWPERIDAETLAEFKRDMGRYAIAGQFQQTPTPRGGGLFERHWFERVDAAPAEGGTICRYWDRAGTEGDGDWTSGLKMLRTSKGLYYVLDVVRLQGSPNKVEAAIHKTATQDGKGVTICLEQDPGQAGKAEVGYHIRQLSGYVVKAIPATRNKETRAMPVASQAEAGNIKIVKGAWNDAFLDEIGWFPRGSNDDQVDTLSGAFNFLNATNKPLFYVRS